MGSKVVFKFSFLTKTKGKSGNRVGAVYKGQGAESNRKGQRCFPSDAYPLEISFVDKSIDKNDKSPATHLSTNRERQKRQK